MQRLAIVAFWAAAGFAVLIASLPQPPQLPGSQNDKLQHIVAFAVLALLAAAAYPRVRLVAIFAGLACLGGGIELIQMIPSLHRDAELADWLSDIVAVATILFTVSIARMWLSVAQ